MPWGRGTCGESWPPDKPCPRPSPSLLGSPRSHSTECTPRGKLRDKTAVWDGVFGLVWQEFSGEAAREEFAAARAGLRRFSRSPELARFMPMQKPLGPRARLRLAPGPPLPAVESSRNPEEPGPSPGPRPSSGVRPGKALGLARNRRGLELGRAQGAGLRWAGLSGAELQGAWPWARIGGTEAGAGRLLGGGA